MTVECQGHVMSLTHGGNKWDDVTVEIQLEQSRCTLPIKIYAKANEVAMYRPGMPVIMQLRPAPTEESK